VLLAELREGGPVGLQGAGAALTSAQVGLLKQGTIKFKDIIEVVSKLQLGKGPCDVAV
jgi:hypothetical protein